MVQALDKLAHHRPALKLDVTPTSATLIALGADDKPIAYQWSNGTLDAATTDFQYLQQNTFSPADFPLDKLGTMFQHAERLGVKGQLVYQIQEYGRAAITQSISSRPETVTVFFLSDATPVPTIGVTLPSDVAAGLAAVTAGDQYITQFGFSKERGYWAFAIDGDEVVTRIRKDHVPTFETRKESTTEELRFKASRIDPVSAVLAMSNARKNAQDACELIVSQPPASPEPIMTIRCGSGTVRTDLAGNNLDDELKNN
ncbi:hypothetical protein [uncultured Tessaracoccus sp.]|uniref:hypothetical protein n=1 Tax=uncultured Tessaracoccus sp. TaxID=905023 RepID=UPI002614DB63|nr:hypothetical protein [uncultured Tessaracoccus sp.]